VVNLPHPNRSTLYGSGFRFDQTQPKSAHVQVFALRELFSVDIIRQVFAKRKHLET